MQYVFRWGSRRWSGGTTAASAAPCSAAAAAATRRPCAGCARCAPCACAAAATTTSTRPATRAPARTPRQTLDYAPLARSSATQQETLPHDVTRRPPSTADPPGSPGFPPLNRERYLHIIYQRILLSSTRQVTRFQYSTRDATFTSYDRDRWE